MRPPVGIGLARRRGPRAGGAPPALAEDRPDETAPDAAAYGPQPLGRRPAADLAAERLVAGRVPRHPIAARVFGAGG